MDLYIQKAKVTDSYGREMYFEKAVEMRIEVTWECEGVGVK